MLTNEKIRKILDSLPNESYRKYVGNKPIALSTEMALALGTQKRQTIKVVATVIDAIASKLFIDTITTNDTAIDTTIQQWLALNRWDTLERKLWRAVVRDGKTYVLAAHNNNIPALYQIDLYNGRDGAYIFKNQYGINTWYDGDLQYLDVYYEDRIEKYVYAHYTDSEWRHLETIQWTDTKNEPLGLALIEYSVGESDLANGTVQLQDDINSALIDLLAVSKTMGWPQRYLKGNNASRVLTNEYGNALILPTGMPIPRTTKFTPGSTHILSKDEELGQLESATPDATVFNTLLHALYIASTVPSYYFTGDWPSGIAITKAETRLDHKVESHQGELSASIEHTLQMMIRLYNTFSDSSVASPTNIEVQWASPQILTEDLKIEQRSNKADYVTALKLAGVMSVETAIRTLHPEWQEEDVQLEVARINGDNTLL